MTTAVPAASSAAPSRVHPAARFVHVPALSRPNHRIDSPFMRDVLAGLSRPRKSIPCTWLYDHRGFELFQAITQVHAYYPTRCEVAILENCASRIASAIGSGSTLVELGSGSCRKARSLLAALPAPSAYVPIDISVEVLTDSARGRHFVFEPGESIHTENSYKHTQTQFRSLAREAGWSSVDCWTDPASGYGVHLLERSCN
jgi:uncharacterized SAM-dependent methyltransferase